MRPLLWSSAGHALNTLAGVFHARPPALIWMDAQAIAGCRESISAQLEPLRPWSQD
jgi:hypothetical protein